jgi:hypothetical protein
MGGGMSGDASTLVRNVPMVNLLEMSPFGVAIENNIAVAECEPG